MDLPRDLDLPLASGKPWWYWLGDRPAMDFANTLRERWWRRVETLVDEDDLVAWLERAGLLPAGSGTAVPTGALAGARKLREAIDACIVAAIEGAQFPPAALAVIDERAADGELRTRLVAGEDGAPVLQMQPAADPVTHALGLIALDAAQMLGDGAQRRRLRVCASDTCSARFYDRSPAGKRRWCSMAGCGNVAKARRHRARLTA